ncbi:MAG: DUF11 domain-containing protein [Sarcina sp.]
MDLKGIDLIQKVSNSKINQGEILIFENKITNKNNEKIFEITLKNNVNLDFSKKYYEFKKNRNGIEISNIRGEIKIDELIPNDEVTIYTSVLIDDKIFTDTLKSCFNIEFFDKAKQKFELNSNENIVKIIRNCESGIEFKIEVDKNIIDEGDFYKLKMTINNEDLISMKDVELTNIIPNKAEFIKGSLYINKSFINIGSELNNIKLGEILPRQKIEVELCIKISQECRAIDIKNIVMLKYSFKNDKDFDDIIKIKSNLINIKIRKSEIINFKKKASKKEVEIGEEITFTITCQNKGNVKLYDLEFSDELGEEFEYIENSFLINGRKSNVKKHDILMLDCLDINEEIKYVYKCLVVKEKKYDKQVMLKYKYASYNGIKMFEKSAICECDDVVVIYTNLDNIYKKFNKENIFVGEEAICEIILKNKGNVIIENIIIKDYLTEQIELIEDSIYINEDKYQSNDISNLKIDKLYTDEEIRVRYKVVAVDINNYKKNYLKKCEIIYEYLVSDKRLTGIKKFDNKNIVINGAVIKNTDLKKLVDKEYAHLDDEINIKLSFINSGNYEAESVFIKENQNSTMKFIVGSLVINDEKSNYNIEDGFFVENLKSNEYLKINYKLKIIKIPDNDITVSTTNIIYETVVAIDGKRSSNMLISQSDTIKIKGANINFTNGIFVRETDKYVLEYNETMRIRINFNNNGNMRAHNVSLFEMLSEGLKISNDKILINGCSKDVINGEINIGNVEIDEDYNIIYDVINTSPISRIVETKSILKYGYYPYKGAPLTFKKGESNITKTKIYNTEVLFNHSSICNEIELNEEFEYNVYIINRGEVELYNIALFFELENSVDIEIMKYEINSMEKKINNLKEKCYIDKIGINKSILITLKLKIINSGRKNNFFIKPILDGYFYEGSEEHKTKKIGEKYFVKINSCKLEILKQTARDVYIKDEIIDYLITIVNDGMQTAENILVKDDNMDNRNIEGKIYLNGNIVNEVCIYGIPIEKLEPGEIATIRYSMKYKESFNKKIILSRVKAIANFIKNNQVIKEYEFFSNKHSVKLKEAKINITRIVNNNEIHQEEKIRFLTIIQNIGDIDLYNLRLNEINLKEFERQEVYINSLLVNTYAKEILLNNLKVGECIEVATEYISNKSKIRSEIINKAVLTYDYQGIDKRKWSKTKESNEVKIKINSNIFKNLNFQHKIYLCTARELLVSEITNIDIEPIITDQYIINTIKNKNNPSNIATGKKIMIRGYFKEKIEYIDQESTGFLNVFSHDENFTIGIVIPEKSDEIEEFRVRMEINDIAYKLMHKKMVLNNINITIELFN